MRGPASAPISLRPPQGSTRLGKRRLVPLDDALAAGRLQVAAELGSFLRRTEGADQGAVVNAFFAEIGALDQRGVGPEHRGVLGLESLVGRLGVGFAPLGGYLYEISAAGTACVGHSLGGICRRDPRGRFARRCRGLRRE